MRTTIHPVSARRVLAPRGRSPAGGSRVAAPGRPRDERRPMRAAREGVAESARRRSEAGEGARRPPSRSALGGARSLPPSGTWDRRRADLYGLAEQWVGPCDVSEDDGIDHLDPLVSPRLRPGGTRRRLVVVRRPGPPARPGARAAATPPLPRRAGPRAPRPPPRPAAPGRHAGAGSLPALVGRGDARPCASHGRPAGGVPPDRLRHEEPAVGAHVPRRRPRRGSVALRRRAHRARAVRAAVALGAP